MFKKSSILVTVLMLVSSTAFASISSRVDSAGYVSRDSTTYIQGNDNITLKVTFMTAKKQKMNYSLDITYEPANSEGAIFAKNVFLSKTKLFGYSTAGTMDDYKITSFSLAMSSRKALLGNGYIISQESPTQATMHRDFTLDYMPAINGLRYDTDNQDYSKLSAFKKVPYWSTNSEFTAKLLSCLSADKSLSLYLMYFNNDVDAVESKNPQRILVTIPLDTLHEWKQILTENNFLK